MLFCCTRKTVQLGPAHAQLWRRHYLKMSRIFPLVQFNYPKAQNKGDKVKKSSFQLMQQTNLLQVASSGTFYMLPLLTRSLEKLCRLIDQEMQGIGAQKINMPCIANRALWEISNRWQEMGSELFHFKDRQDVDFCLAPTHEEAVTSLVRNLSPVSYKQLPIKLYQIGKKFRDEMRPKNGLLRCREFEMKDLYTFDEDEHSAQKTYDEVLGAYRKIFDRLDIRYYQVEASTGAMGGDSSHEFHIAASLGEDRLWKCQSCDRVYNEELVNRNNTESNKFHCTNCQSTKFEQFSGIEIGHCFILGTKYSSAQNAMYTNANCQKKPFYMGCYGIGVSRLLAAVLEDLDTINIKWPRLIAPYQVVVLPMPKGFNSDKSYKLAENVSNRLSSMANLRNEVVLDDRVNMSIGKRLRAARHVGFPYAVVMGRQSVEEESLLEFIDLKSDKTEFYTEEQVTQHLSVLETL